MQSAAQDIACMMSLKNHLCSTFVVIAVVVAGCSKVGQETTVQEKQLTDQQKLDIAAQVVRGERPKSDLEK
jgi:hypothetical protein